MRAGILQSFSPQRPVNCGPTQKIGRPGDLDEEAAQS
jgi:hypothetical protein